MTQPIHGTLVARAGRGVLIVGASGTGKSALALELMGFGADLVADDRVHLTAEDGALVATCPPALQGRIEARGIGIIKAPFVETAKVVLVADLDQAPEGRLPIPQTRRINAVSTPLVCLKGVLRPAAALWVILNGELEAHK